MDEKELRQLLRSRTSVTRRHWRCPDENQIAGYISGQFEKQKRLRLESHFAKCDSCLGAIAFLVQSTAWPISDQVPVQLLSRAMNLVHRKPSSVWRWRWAMASAAAASALLVVAFFAYRARSLETVAPPNGDLIAQQQQQPDVPVVQPTASIQDSESEGIPAPKPKIQGPPIPSVRSEPSGLDPTLVFPRDGALLRHNQLNFSWKPITGVSFYEVTVVTDEGALVFSETTSEPHLKVREKPLRAGKYFVRVVARMPDGSATKSKMVSFRLTGD